MQVGESFFSDSNSLLDHMEGPAGERTVDTPLRKLAKDEVALAEMKILQDIIARQDGFKDKTKTLVLTFFSAFSVAYLSGNIRLSALQYVLGAWGIIIPFVLLEGVYGATEMNAERRVRRIESYFRGDIALYDGPAVSRAMDGNVRQKIWPSIKRWRTFSLYAFLVAISLATSLIKTLRPATLSVTEQKLERLLSVFEKLDHRLEEVDRRSRASSVPAKSHDEDLSTNKRP